MENSGALNTVPQSPLEFFISEFIPTTPPEKWEDEVWPMVKQYNALQAPPLEETLLRSMYLLATDAVLAVSNKQEEVAILKNFVANKVSGTYDVASYLTRKFKIITVGEKEREMYVYRNGMYGRAENEIIFPEIQRILQKHTTKNAKNEVFHKIADMTSCPRSIFDSAPLHLIPLRNGVYDRANKILRPHGSEYHFTYQLPVFYDPNAHCPRTLEFFQQVLTEDQVTLIQEWIGYYFLRQYLFKKAIIFVGEGDTGKTTLLETIMHLVGRDNISSVSLQKMTSDKFAAAHLYEKHGNLVDELSANDIRDTGNFKIATGGGSISGEYKFGNQFSFHNFAKFTFACNRIPDVTDFQDEAYFNRWLVVRFGKTIEKKIPNFIETLTTEEERSGLFNYALEGLERLTNNGGFSLGKSAVDTKLEMMRSGSSIAVFAADRVTQETGAEISKEQMYEAYEKFCIKEGVAIETIKMFGSKFLFYVPYASEGWVYDEKNGRSSKQTKGWRNVKIVLGPDEAEEEKKLEDEFNTL